MSYEKTVSEHYTHGDLLESIKDAITILGKTPDSITIDDIAPIDEFHIGGRLATNNLLDQLELTEHDHVLDVGCGLGGTSRCIVSKLDNHVTGIDLTQEYVDVGNALSAWVGMESQVDLCQGSALSMPFDDESFDGAVMLHVGMNIEDKLRLFSEVHRVLRPKTRFAIYDIMRMDAGDLVYPMPWASESATSKLATLDYYKQSLNHVGFEIDHEDNRGEFALEFFQQVRANIEAKGGPTVLDLHILMPDSATVKIDNMVDNIDAGLIAPVELIARKI